MLFHKIKDTYVQYMSHCEIDSNLIVVTIIVGGAAKVENERERITEFYWLGLRNISSLTLSHRTFCPTE